jgi:hypothetical protein
VWDVQSLSTGKGGPQAGRHDERVDRKSGGARRLRRGFFGSDRLSGFGKEPAAEPLGSDLGLREDCRSGTLPRGINISEQWRRSNIRYGIEDELATDEAPMNTDRKANHRLMGVDRGLIGGKSGFEITPKLRCVFD